MVRPRERNTEGKREALWEHSQSLTAALQSPGLFVVDQLSGYV